MRQLSGELEDKVAQRTVELKRVHARLLSTETERSRSKKRATMSQGMHDGFKFHLVIAKIRGERQQMCQPDLALLIQEAIADLHLVVDKLGNKSEYLPKALIDFQSRTQQRMVGSNTQMQ